MICRYAKLEDWDAIVEISKKREYPLPDFKNLLVTLVVEDEGKIVSFGYLIKYVETVFAPDPDSSDKDKVKSLKLLQGRLKEEARSFGINQINCFVLDNSFKDILTKHFGYAPSTGAALYLDIE